VSRPSAHQNRLNQQKTKEKKLSRKWHSSYAPHDKIEGVEIKKANSPAFNAGLRFFFLHAGTTLKTSHPEPESTTFWPESSPFQA
jgi:hypothetical protein